MIPPWRVFWKKPISSRVVVLVYTKGNNTRINQCDYFSGWTRSIWLGLGEMEAFTGPLALLRLSVFCKKSVLSWVSRAQKRVIFKVIQDWICSIPPAWEQETKRVRVRPKGRKEGREGGTEGGRRKGGRKEGQKKLRGNIYNAKEVNTRSTDCNLWLLFGSR